MEKSKLFKLSLFIFRRDLRLIDNTALNIANLNSKFIIPAFFLDSKQVDKNENEYFSSNSIQFMIESLANLNTNLNKFNSKLFLFYGDLHKNIERIIKEANIEAIYLNEDYTPYAVKRDNEIKEICKKNNVQFFSCEDVLLTGVNSVKQANGNFYKKYTPYYNAASLIKIPEIKTEKNFNFINLNGNQNENFLVYEKIKKSFNDNNIDNNKTLDNKINFLFDFSSEKEDLIVNQVLKFLKITYNKNVIVKGGRVAAEEKLSLLKKFKNYKDSRNFPIIPSTRLSAYNKFGIVSPREVFYIVKENFGAQHDIIRQLHWRDFYIKVAYYFPFVIGGAMKPEYNKINWQPNPLHIEKWKKGETGFPIVDAAMRCLNTTGYMHNRLRMITSSFFVKDILADWRIGEKYFANSLVDYDISLNNGGWQWSASTGTDSQPYFRIFNPALQSEKFDKDCHFIFEWIPELKNSSIKKEHIHDWEKFHKLYKGKINYPEPMLCHADQKGKAILMFKKLYEDKDKDKEKVEYEEDEVTDQEILPMKKDRKQNIREGKKEKNIKNSEINASSISNSKKKKAIEDKQCLIMDALKIGSKKKK